MRQKYWWSFYRIGKARHAKICNLCEKWIEKGETYRMGGRREGRSGSASRYHLKCVGLIASRYHKVRLDNLSPIELDWKLIFDAEILTKVYGENYTFASEV